MRKNKLIVLTAILLSAVLTLTACNNGRNVPELVEPVGGQQTFRPVSRRNMGKMDILVGNVTAKQYCHFFKDNVAIDSIECSIGQYVNEGDVVCKADVEAVKQQIDSLNAQVKLLNIAHSEDATINECLLENATNNKQLTEYMKNMGQASEEDIKNAENQIDMCYENERYSKEMYDYQLKKLNESIAELQKIADDGTLKAKKSGYVTYVKSLEDGNLAKANENVVVISDYEDKYIEILETTNSYKFSKYELKFAYIDGIKTPITEFNYTEEELAYANAEKAYPLQRFVPVEDVDLTLGDKVVLQFYKFDKNDVLCVGRDSSQSDEDGLFVYVKNEDGTLEKRYYEAGLFDTFYIEVLDGLEEGEMVLYEQESPVPTDYEEYTVGRGDYSDITSVKGVKKTEANGQMYFAEDTGVVKNIYFGIGDEVKKGDVLLEIEIDAKLGEVSQKQNEVTKIKNAHEDSENQFTKDYEALSKSITELKTDIDQKSLVLEDVKKKIENGTATEKDYENKVMLEISINTENCTLQSLENSLTMLDCNHRIELASYPIELDEANKALNNQKKKNDGTGTKKIVAKADGIVKTVSVSEGNKVGPNDKIVLMYVVNYQPDQAWLVAHDSSVNLGYEFTIDGEDGSYKAVCVSPAVSYSVNLFTEDGDVYLTNSSGSGGKYFTSRIDDEKFFGNYLNDYEATIETGTYSNMIMIPGDCLYKETAYDKTVQYFVWRIEDGMPVKQFVTRGTEYKIANDSSVIILEGLSEGDVVVR